MTNVSNRELFNVANDAISRYHKLLSSMRYDNSGPSLDRDYYGFIPSSPGFVIEALIKAMKLMEKYEPLSQNCTHYKFLDAGCGAGNIMLLAACVGFDVWGIERDEKTIKLARKLFHCFNKRGRGIIKADLIEYKRYGEYDVIYYYQPMQGKKMDLFVNALCKQMKVGAIVLAFGDGGRQVPGDKRFKQYRSRYVHIYRKTKA